MRNLNVGTKISLAFGASIALGAGITVFLLLELGRLNAEFDHLANTELHQQAELRDITISLQKQVHGLKNMLLRGRKADLAAAAREDFLTNRNEIAQKVQSLHDETMSDQIRTKLKEFLSLHGHYSQDCLAAVDAGNLQGGGDPVGVDGILKGKDRTLSAFLAETITVLDGHVDQVRARQRGELTQETRIIAGVSAILLGLLLLGCFLIVRAITSPLTQAVGVLQAVAEGDLTQTLRVNSRDEVDRMAGSLNQTILQLREAEEAKERRRREDEERVAQERIRERQQVERERAQERQRVKEEQERAQREQELERQPVKEEQERAQREQELERKRVVQDRTQAEALREKVDTLLAVVEAASTGDLTREITVRGEDPIGRMGQGLEKFLTELRTNIATIAGNAQFLI